MLIEGFPAIFSTVPYRMPYNTLIPRMIVKMLSCGISTVVNYAHLRHSKCGISSFVMEPRHLTCHLRLKVHVIHVSQGADQTQRGHQANSLPDLQQSHWSHWFHCIPLMLCGSRRELVLALWIAYSLYKRMYIYIYMFMHI